MCNAHGPRQVGRTAETGRRGGRGNGEDLVHSSLVSRVSLQGNRGDGWLNLTSVRYLFGLRVPLLEELGNKKDVSLLLDVGTWLNGPFFGDSGMIEKRIARRWHAAGGGGPGQDLDTDQAAGRRTVGKKRRAGGGGGAGAGQGTQCGKHEKRGGRKGGW